MKKIFIILLFSFLANGNALAEKINLSCSSETQQFPLSSVVIDTEIKKISWQGSAFDWYNLKNDVFYFLMENPPYKFLSSLNRNTGVLTVKAYQISEEDNIKIMSEMYLKMLRDAKTSEDKEYMVDLMYETYTNSEAEETIYLDCEKTQKKF